jgi:hypothetical protein
MRASAACRFLKSSLRGDLIMAHKFFGGLIWWYLAGHVGMAVLHKMTPKRFQKEF